MGVTMTRWEWVRALMREDLPTLGRPTTASLRARWRPPELPAAAGGGFGRQQGHGGVHQRVDAALVNGADREDLAETQGGKFIGPGFVAVVVGLIDSDQHLLAGALQALGDLAVQGDDPFLHIDHQDNDGRGVDGHLHLLEAAWAMMSPPFRRARVRCRRYQPG